MKSENLNTKIIESEQSIFDVKLSVFEGPLDLLLHLIKENQIDIYDIPIALITRQYLDYLDLMKELNLHVAGEFLVMAATLIQIKSRMLLPPSITDKKEEEEGTDPRAELVEKLLEYQKYKTAAEELEKKESLWREIFYRQPSGIHEMVKDDTEPLLFDVNLFDLLSALKGVLEKIPSDAVEEITRERLTIKDKINMILERLSECESIVFDLLFHGDKTRADVITTFLALLEIIRLRLARVFQSKEFGIIRILKAVNSGR